MVAIGRAMMSNPQILTLDEPSLGLSPLLCKELFQNLKAVRDLGLGVLLVEQNAKQSLAIADRGYLLENAHIVHEDTAANLSRDPAVQAAYLGAGGAAAPHTHDEPAPATPPETAPQPVTEIAQAALQRFEARPRAVVRQSADALAGGSIAEMVARASQSGQTAARSETPKAQTLSTPDTAPVEDPDARLRRALDAIERSAAAARRPNSGGRSKQLERRALEPVRDKLNRRWQVDD